MLRRCGGVLAIGAVAACLVILVGTAVSACARTTAATSISDAGVPTSATPTTAPPPSTTLSTAAPTPAVSAGNETTTTAVGPSDALVDYAVAIYRVVAEMDPALTTIREWVDTQKPSKDDVRKAIETIREQAEIGLKIKPPVEATGMHMYFQQFLWHLQNGCERLEYAFTKPDESEIKYAETAFLEAFEDLTAVKEQIPPR